MVGAAGLRGHKTIAALFAVVGAGDVVLTTALGLHDPSTWSAPELVVDVVDELVQAGAIGVVFDSMREV